MNIPFKKIHGAGNDFIVIKYEDFPYEEHFSLLAGKVCHRHFGIGADGILIVGKSSIADLKMFYYNGDGSLANMCGNGIRCFAKFAYDEGLVNKQSFSVETLAGPLSLELKLNNHQVTSVRVNMGKMIFTPSDIPVVSSKPSFINETIEVKGRKFKISSVLMGVPHTVIFTRELTPEVVRQYGPEIEKNPLFPENTNVNFAKIINRHHIQVKTWERGAGYTLACGTGVTSVCGIAHHLGLVDHQVQVEIDGGRLDIELLPSGEIVMEGPAQDICKGIYYHKE
ncbi:diaminopimelate epimerase [Alkaliphilus crotonatoxidans]